MTSKDTSSPISKDELRKEFLKLCEKHRVSEGFNFSEDTFENEAVALITQQNLQLLERLKGEKRDLYSQEAGKPYATYRGASNIHYKSIEAIPLSAITSLEKEIRENSV